MARVLQVCPNDHPPFVDVCRGYAAALTARDHDVETVFLEDRGFFDTTSTFPGRVRFAPSVGRVAVDAIVAHRWGGFRASRHLPVAVRILVAHEFGLLRSWSRRIGRWRRPGLRFAGVSAPVAADIAAHGIDDVLVLPNPIDVDTLARERLGRDAARKALNLPAGETVIAVVGRLHPKKDPLRAIAPFGAFRATNPGTRLAFLGDGELREPLEEAIESEPAIVSLGHVPDARRYFAAFDILLACATEREAFGMVLLEAMAAGVPVVCADQPGPREVLGDLGFYFDDDHSLLGALHRVAVLDRVPRANWAHRADDRVRRNFSVFALGDRLQTVVG